MGKKEQNNEQPSGNKALLKEYRNVNLPECNKARVATITKI